MSDIDYTPGIPETPTITIELTRGYSTIVDAVDSDLADINWHTKIVPCTCYAKRGKRIDERYADIYLHQVILSRMLGRTLVKGEKVDHEDGDGLNNTRQNLRLATSAENNHNRRKNSNNRSGFKGVFWDKDKKKWKAQIQVNGKKKHLGYFNTPKDAHAAYCAAALEYYGEFARFA